MHSHSQNSKASKIVKPLDIDLSLPNFNQLSVLVVGDIMLDRYWSGDSERISPEAPIPVVKIDNSEDRIGGAGNVALNAASLGVRTVLLGIAGKDSESKIIQEKLEAADVSCELIQHTDVKTITKLRVMSRHQQMLRLDFEEPLNAGQALEELKSRFIQLLLSQDFGAIIFSDYAKGTLEHVQELIQIAKAKNITCLVDPKGTDFSKYHDADLLTPNRSEFEAVVGSCVTEEALNEQAQSLIDKYSLNGILVTRSEEGMTAFECNDGERDSYHFPALASEVFDVTGAGDTVIATLAACLASGSGLSNATAIANYAASIVVSKSGTASISLHELNSGLSNGLNNVLSSRRGMLSAEQLKDRIIDSQKANDSVVMTNGCFDIIHAGHISYLEEAKNLGDKLIVAVNSDASVKRLKGDARPINTLERRMQVLAGLEAVDWVVAFEEDTPAALVAEVLPDILVKGGDWDITEIAGGEAVVANGGKVMSLSFKEGHSTTAMIDLIKERENS